MLIRQDGDFTVYVLEIKVGTGKPWFKPNFDSYGYPFGFRASDECWQKLGIHATFDKDTAFNALKEMSKKYPSNDWRLLKVTLQQKHKEVAILLREE